MPQISERLSDKNKHCQKIILESLSDEYFCSMKSLSPEEAWIDFLQNCLPDVRAKHGSRRPHTPDDIRKAIEATTGKRKHPLGTARIRHLLEKYAPERYEFIERVEVIVRDAAKP